MELAPEEVRVVLELKDLHPLSSHVTPDEEHAMLLRARTGTR